MIPDLSSQIADLDSLRNSWLVVAMSFPDPTDIDARGTNADEVTSKFEEIRSFFSSLATTNISGIAWTVQEPKLANALASLATSLPAVPVNITSMIQNLPTIYRHLIDIQEYLLFIFPPVPLTPAQTRGMQSKFAVVGDLLEKSKVVERELTVMATSAASTVVLIEANRTSSDNSLQNIQNSVVEVSKTLSIVEAAKIEAVRLTEETGATNASVVEVSKDLVEAQRNKDLLFEKFEAQRVKIDELLENASKVGLAKSFKDARERKRWPMGIWGSVFLGSLIAITKMGNEVLNAFLVNQSDVIKNDLTTYQSSTTTYEFLARVGLTAPLILIAVFAAKQYGLASRLSEDYAFKEATALAYTGYRNEVAIDPDLLKYLQVSAISTFGSNPMHLISDDDESPSLISEGIRTILGNIAKGKSN